MVPSGPDRAARLADAADYLDVGVHMGSAFSGGVMRDHRPFLQKPVADDLLAKTAEDVLKACRTR